MKIADIIAALEKLAPPSLQESYDNAGLLTGNPSWECTGVICALDATEGVIDEAVKKGCNLVVAHHPIIFSGLKKINGKNYVERTVISAIKQDIAIYAIHTNLDNVLEGVNGKMAARLGLNPISVLAPQSANFRKLVTFVPPSHIEKVQQAIFDAGAGRIGNYSDCGFSVTGTGTFTPGNNATPFSGKAGERHEAEEIRLEAVFATHLQGAIIQALRTAHPYEEVAFDILQLENPAPGTGAGLLGEFAEPVSATELLEKLKKLFGLTCLRHTLLPDRPIKKAALCGGAGSFLISKALAAGADVFITADLKYHEFFDADNRILLVDIGHFESEQFTIDLLHDVLTEKFPTFAVLKTTVRTNPVYYS